MQLFLKTLIVVHLIIEKGGYVVCYEMSDIEKKLGLGRHSLVSFVFFFSFLIQKFSFWLCVAIVDYSIVLFQVALSLLLGSDYSHGVRGFGPVSMVTNMCFSWKYCQL